MEADLGEVALGHLEDVAGVGEEYVAAVAVYCHELVLALLEGGEGFGIVAFDPAGFVERDRFPAALCSVFVKQAVLDHFKLELTYGADDLAAIELVDKQLGHTFVHELLDAFLELLRLHRVGVFDVFEHLWRETRQSAVVELFARGEGIADLEVAGIGYADYVAGEGFVDNALFLGHECRGSGEAEHFSGTDVAVGGVALEFARAHFDKRYAAAVVGIHVGMDLEHESRKCLLVGAYFALLGHDRLGRRGYLDETVEQFLDAEGVERAAEEYRGDLAGQILIDRQFGIHPLDKLQIIAQFGGIGLTYGLVDTRVVDVVDFHAFRYALFVGRKQIERVFVDVVHTFEFRAYVDRPAERAYRYFQFGFQLVEYLERVATLAVELVDEYDHRGVAHAAHLHELAGLLLHAFGHVDHDDHRVDGGEGAVGVLGEVLVARGVENIDLVGAVVEAHDRCGYRYAALLLYFHPVAGGGLLDLVALYGAGYVDGTAEKQQLFGESRFTGVGVRDDGERASPAYFVVDGCHGIGWVLSDALGGYGGLFFSVVDAGYAVLQAVDPVWNFDVVGRFDAAFVKDAVERT